MPDIPQIALPMRVVNGQLLEVEQGSGDDVVGQITALVVTPPGRLGMNEDDPVRTFGLVGQEHAQGGADPIEVEQQIADHIPDFDGAVDERLDEINTTLSIVNVRIGAA